ncbi:MAG TPA: NUDIX hydrolase [Sedimentisphaerales bacterium]|nr:NUDIX hydrolase [Sedimentisphaerales bacterium]HRV48747.1 NUDIX hydrolase [Sedimentisphaerales bacterium]
MRWAKQVAALAQNGLTFSDNPYDIERYEHLREIAAEMMAEGFDLDKKSVIDLLRQEQGYATPKVDVRGAAFRDGKILLVREALDGGWTLPGGWADPCQSPSEAVVREIFEESGFEARVCKLAAIYDRSKHPHLPLIPFHIYKLFFLCEITGGHATESHETTGVGFFAEDAIPDLSISRTLPFQIARMFDHLRDPALPTDFD